MAQLTLRFVDSASAACTNSTFQMPKTDMSLLMNGISVNRFDDATQKSSQEFWKLDSSKDSIICERLDAYKLFPPFVCSQRTSTLDIQTILKATEMSESALSLRLHYINQEKRKTVSCILSFANEVTCKCFLKAIGYMINKSRLKDAKMRRFNYICTVFSQHDKDGNGYLDKSELQKVYADLKIRQNDNLFDYLYKKFSNSQSSQLDFKVSGQNRSDSNQGLSVNDFVRLYTMLYTLIDVELIFCTYALSNGSINVQHFARFLKNEQREQIPPAQCEKIIKDVEVSPDAQEGCDLTLDGFIGFLFSDKHNSIKNLSFIKKPHQPMDMPFDRYFIKSCFIVSDSESGTPKKLAMHYESALKEGFRHFEIDLYASKDSMSVFASYANESSSKIEISKLISVLKKADLSNGPLLLSLNIHFKGDDSPKHLKALANTLISGFGEMMGVFSNVSHSFPTLKDLFGKVLIRSSLSKCLKIESEGEEADVKFSSLIAFDNLGDAQESMNNSDNQKSADDTEVNINGTNGDSNDQTNENKPAATTEKNVSPPTPSKYQTLSFKSAVYAKFSSMNEEQAVNIANDYFVSVSPENSFQNSHPTMFWNFGVQSVFLPYPKSNLHSELNNAFFEMNGNCGYVAKPKDILEYEASNDKLSMSRTFDDDNMSTISTNTQMPGDHVTVTISVICAHLISKISTKPFVYVELYGPKPMFGATDVAEGKKDTSKINPRFNNQFVITIPKSAYQNTIVQISLWDYKAISNGEQKEEILGRCSVHIHAMRQGFRVVNLKDDKGTPLDPTSILVHVRKNKTKIGSSGSLASLQGQHANYPQAA